MRTYAEVCGGMGPVKLRGTAVKLAQCVTQCSRPCRKSREPNYAGTRIYVSLVCRRPASFALLTALRPTGLARIKSLGRQDSRRGQMRPGLGETAYAPHVSQRGVHQLPLQPTSCMAANSCELCFEAIACEPCGRLRTGLAMLAPCVCMPCSW